MRNFEKIADRIVSEVDDAVREMESKIENVTRKAESRVQNAWKSGPRWRKTRTAKDFQSAADQIRRFPTQITDMATDGSCVMRYLFAFGFKGLAILQAFGGLICIAVDLGKGNSWHGDEFSVGLVLLITAQGFWWIGHRVRKSADQKSYERDQHKLLRLARKKGGNLTVLEAATDSKITVEIAETILRDLALKGHAEVRVSDSGVMVYHFPEISRWEEKHWARPVDEL